MKKGIHYLGFKLKQTECAAQPLKLFADPSKKWKFIQSIKRLEKKPPPETRRPHVLAPLLIDKNVTREISSVNSRLGSIIHAESLRFRKKALLKFLEETKEQRGIPEEIADDWAPFKIKTGYRAIGLW